MMLVEPFAWSYCTFLKLRDLDNDLESKGRGYSEGGIISCR